MASGATGLPNFKIDAGKVHRTWFSNRIYSNCWCQIPRIRGILGSTQMILDPLQKILNLLGSIYGSWRYLIHGDVIFRVTGPLCGEFAGHQWIPLTKASDTDLWCFLWSGPGPKSKQSRRRWFEIYFCPQVAQSMISYESCSVGRPCYCVLPNGKNALLPSMPQGPVLLTGIKFNAK